MPLAEFGDRQLISDYRFLEEAVGLRDSSVRDTQRMLQSQKLQQLRQLQTSVDLLALICSRLHAQSELIDLTESYGILIVGMLGCEGQDRVPWLQFAKLHSLAYPGMHGKSACGRRRASIWHAWDVRTGHRSADTAHLPRLKYYACVTEGPTLVCRPGYAT